MNELVLDAILAWAHFLAVGGLAVILALELAVCRPGLAGPALRRLARLDLVYAGLAAAVLATGASRAAFGLKGWDYYAANPVFWTKVGVFVLIGILSAPPTRQFLRWARAQRNENDAFAPPPADIRKARRFIHAELGLLVLLPGLGAMLSRGLGF